MSELAIIKNPLGDTELLQFYITSSFNLGLDKWTASSGGGEQQATTSDVGLTGPLLSPASIVVVQNQNEIKVFGYICKKDTSNPPKVQVALAQLSPAFGLLPLPSTLWQDQSIYGQNIGVVQADADTAHVLYIMSVNKNPTLKYHTVAPTAADTTPGVSTQPVLGSYITGYHSSNDFAIYQISTGDIREVNLGTLDDDTVDNSEAKSLTPLAVCLGGSDGTTVYVYFVNSEDLIYRNIKSGGSWGSPETVGGKNHHKTSDSTQLAVVPDSTTSSNSVFYIPDGESTYTRIKDSW